MPMSCRSHVVELLANLIELFLALLELVVAFLILLFPHVSLGLDGCNLALVVLGFDIGKAEPKAHVRFNCPVTNDTITGPRNHKPPWWSCAEEIVAVERGGVGQWGISLLLVGFAEVLVCLFGFIFEQLQLSLQSIKLRAVGSSAVSGVFGFGECLLQFFHFLVEKGIAMGEGADFLLFSQVLLFEDLYAVLEFLVLGLGLLGLHTEGSHFLEDASAFYHRKQGASIVDSVTGKSRVASIKDSFPP